MQNTKTGHFEGLNEIIQQDAIDEEYLEVTKSDLNIYGRNTRPLFVALSYFSDVNLPITNNTNETMAILEELGIDYDFSNTRPHLTVNFQNGFDDHYFIKKDIDVSEIVMQEEEVQDFKWATKSEIEQLFDEGKFVPYVKEFVLALFELKDIHGAIKD